MSLHRVALSVASINEIPIIIENIRNGRPKPGLSQQHVQCNNLVHMITNGIIEGNRIGSQTLSFTPGNQGLQPSYDVNIGTAGSCTLLMQCVLPIILMKMTKYHYAGENICVSITGGTNVSHSPPIDHLKFVLIPLIQHMNIHVDIMIERRGYFPKGNGQVRAIIFPLLNPSGSIDFIQPIILLNQGRPIRVNGIIFGNGILFDDKATDYRRTITKQLRHKFPYLVNEVINVSIADDTRSTHIKGKDTTLGVQLWITTDTGCILSGNSLVSYSDHLYSH